VNYFTAVLEPVKHNIFRLISTLEASPPFALHVVDLESFTLGVAVMRTPHAVLQHPRIADADAGALLLHPGGLPVQFDKTLAVPISDESIDDGQAVFQVVPAAASPVAVAAVETHAGGEEQRVAYDLVGDAGGRAINEWVPVDHF
jgi:hypothetical protein